MFGGKWKERVRILESKLHCAELRQGHDREAINRLNASVEKLQRNLRSVLGVLPAEQQEALNQERISYLVSVHGDGI